MVGVIEVTARRAFNPTRIPGASHVINQYIGCQYSCRYCYARFVSRYNYGKWGSWVIIRRNMPELVRGRRVRGIVYMSSISDPYQPLEEKLELTKRVIENMDKSISLRILTKSDLVLRDIDLFKEFEDIEVGLTINSLGKFEREIEPLSPTSERRTEALKGIHESGIKNYAFISPIIPLVTDIEELIDETKGFVDSYWFEFLNLKRSGREFREWLRKRAPRSYRVLSDETEFRDYAGRVIDIIRSKGVSVRGDLHSLPKNHYFE